ncbi:uncharacterized protein LOC117125137 [Anneissia japonica]|uniref:uncharacterized protein LOC117125137 n=1 Tax=Anneissia japonica TaxID=1529436 RepID=UPI0014257905|nr:uncharacterized protein LOC117125137 [Anneissia japonica]
MEDIINEIDGKQYGSRKKSSTTHYLVNLFNTVLSDIDSGGRFVNLCTIDFTKAFDRVDHTVLINKLINVVVRPSIIPVISSFVSNRVINTIFKQCVSSTIGITCAVPQGTKLGLILFLVLVNDVARNVPRRWKYVDDLTFGEVMNAKREEQKMQSILDNVSLWCTNKYMLPKLSKCHIMIVSFLQSRTPDPIVTLNDQVIHVVDSMKLLGVIIQNDLKWDKHVNECIYKASKLLFTLSILRKAKAPVNDLLCVFITYIRPVLEYAYPLWHISLTIIQRNRIERVQKRALRSIFGMDYCSYDNALILSGLSSLNTRRDNLMMKFGNELLASKLFRDICFPLSQSR